MVIDGESSVSGYKFHLMENLIVQWTYLERTGQGLKIQIRFTSQVDINKIRVRTRVNQSLDGPLVWQQTDENMG